MGSKPFLVAKVPREVSPDEREHFMRALSNLGTETVLCIPHDYDIEYIGPAPDIATERCDNCGAPVEPACTCQNVRGVAGVIGRAVNPTCAAVRHEPRRHTCRYCGVHRGH